jgi:MFS family permease
LIGAAVMLSLGMGLRQSLGLFMPPLTRDLPVSVADFTLAVAVQNLAWGALQPIAGAWVVRLGFRPIVVAGAAFYAAGLATLAAAHDALGVLIGAGVLIGLALACTASAIAMAVASRTVSAAARSTGHGHRRGIDRRADRRADRPGPFRRARLARRRGRLSRARAHHAAGRVARRRCREVGAYGAEPSSACVVLLGSLKHVPFVVMTSAYFVCGLQLVLITTHLPAYLALCGMDPMLSAAALGVIGGFNVLGSLFFGWAGGRWSKRALLGLIYTLRSLGLACYFALPPTPASTLAFAAVMGFLWLGVGPLIAGSVAEMFGLRWQAMIQGVAFVSHQIGSFVGALGSGLLFETLGNYDLAWRLAVAMGLTAGVVQLVSALTLHRRLAPATTTR